MRVISGKYKGKKIDGFQIEGTRPTMDRVKESLFAILQKDVQDSLVLDLFAGSGALGIEALSVGAKEAHFVEYGKEILKILKKNLDGIENAHLYFMDAFDAISMFEKKNIKFSLVFLDPPYALNLITPTLQKLSKIVEPGAIIVCEYENEKIEVDSHYREIKTRKYGSKNLSIYSYQE